MTAALVTNVAAYSLQLLAVVVTAVAATWIWPPREPRRAHRVWQGLFVASVGLPLVALWPHASTSATAAWFVASVSAVEQGTAPGANWQPIASMVLAGGALARIVWLALGLLTVRRYVRRAVPLDVSSSRTPRELATVRPAPMVCLSTDVHSPVTVGVIRPVVLLPLAWVDLPDDSAKAVLLHEVTHVQRWDWLRVCAEEVWCALLWFHPAARALVTRLDTAREMVVDQRVVTSLGDWRSYARTLIAFSEASDRVARPVASLIRPRHLNVRIRALSEEAHMRRDPKHHVAIVVSVVATVLVGSVWAVPLPGRGLLPVSAERRSQDDVFAIGNGVSSPRVTHEVKANYTQAALDAKIAGEVWLSVVVRKDGTVGDVAIRKSLDSKFGLDEAAVSAVRQWTFEPAQRNGAPVAVRVAVEIRFTLRD